MPKNTMRLDTSGFDDYIRRLESLGVNVQSDVTDALQKAADQVTQDTYDALSKVNLPAKGKYSSGKTRDSVIAHPEVKWSGTVASVPVGFDFDKPGAGGYLISGTPKMKPDLVLNNMYRKKRYMAQITEGIGNTLMGRIYREMEGQA